MESNAIYNLTNKRPPIPIDADEADSAMERIIRSKYKDVRTDDGFQAPRGGNRDYLRDSAYEDRPPRSSRRPETPDSDDIPPPVPAKTGSRFGFRSASSIFPMSSKSKREAQARAHLESQNQMCNGPYRRAEKEAPTPPRKNKPSRVFGTPVAAPDEQEENMINKLARLRDMGFTDEKRNLTVLKGLNGNFEKSVATLVRLGEKKQPRFEKLGSISRSASPSTAQPSAGLSFDRPKPSPISSSHSNNPWEAPSAAPQTAQSTGGIGAPKPIEKDGQHSLNPFGFATRSQMNLNQQYNSLGQSFQNLNVSSQQLFPNHTGGAPRIQPFQTAAAPPMPSIPQGQYSSGVYTPVSQQSPSMPGYNPFLQQQQTSEPQPLLTPQFTASNPFGSIGRAQTFLGQMNGAQGQTHTPIQDLFNQAAPQQAQQANPYGQQQPLQMQPQQTENPYFQQPQQMPQPQQVSQNPYGQEHMQQQSSQNPYGSQYQQPAHNYQQQPQLMPQRTGMDKSSIMAMFSQAPSMPSPQPQPQFDAQQQQQQQSQQPQQSQNQSVYQPPTQQLPLQTITQYQAQPQQSPPQHQQNHNRYQQPPQLQQQQSFGGLATVLEQTGSGASPLSSTTGFGGAKNPFMHSSQNQQSVQQNGNVLHQGGLLAASGIGGLTSSSSVGSSLFDAGGSPQAAGGGMGMGGARSRDSMLASSGWNPNNGRHSPDAFASLSSRVR